MMALLALAGFALLACGTWRQSALAFGSVPRARVRHALLGGGYALLAASLALPLADPEPWQRLVQWFGILTLAAAAPLLAFWGWGSLRR